MRSSWSKLLPEADALAALFYKRLFAVQPTTRRLFGAKNMEIQGMLFTQMLALFIRSLDDDLGLVEALQASGRRHVSYGVMHSDYDNVGAALLWTIEQRLGDDFTPAVRAAWAAAYESLATAMRHAGTSVL